MSLPTRWYSAGSALSSASREPEVIKLSFHGKHLQFPDYVEPSLCQLAEATRMTVRDIDGELDVAGKLVLVRSLVREGFLILDRD